ncbi:MAG: arylesterase [Acidobacteriota bacterium]
MNLRALQAFGLALALTACGGSSEPVQQPGNQAAPQATATPSATADPATQVMDEHNLEEHTLIVFLGDSLTAGFGLDEAQAFPALVANQLQEAGHTVRVVNAGISGDTTAGGLARLDWLLSQNPDILFVGLGGNDGLRGVPLESSEATLRAILERAQARDISLLLAGMLIPPNYGADYTEHFAGIYPRLAEELGVPLIPFLLEGVAAQPELNLPDGIHPNVEGQKIVAATVLEYLAPIVAEVGGEKSTSGS